MKKISIGVACYNEEGNVENTYNAVIETLKELPNYDYEIIFADNNSTDETQNILRKLAKKNKKVKLIFNSINFGPNRSGINLLYSTTGDVFFSIPADLQEPIDMLPEFIKYWEQGYDIVWGQKTKSNESKIKYVCRNIYYNIIDRFSEYKQLHLATGFGVMDRKVLDVLKETLLQDPEEEIRNLVVECGFRIKLIPYTQNARVWGKSSYSSAKYFSFAITTLCNTSIKPLHLMTIFGFFFGIICILIGIIYFIYKLIHWGSFDLGVAPVIIGLFLCSGIQLFAIGILGEYISILLKKIKARPLVIEKERINFSTEDVDKTE